MLTIKQPSQIIFGENSACSFSYPEKSLIITSKGSLSRGWINYLKIKNFSIYDDVEPNPSLETVEKILNEFPETYSCIIGLGGGSSLDTAKFIANKKNLKKILIPTTFGSGSEVTRISVLKVNGNKTSFHDDNLFADISIIDPNFLKNCPFEIIRNSAIDACAQCSEAFDSKISNIYTKFLCQNAFDILEKSLIEKNYSNLAYGALISGLGFGNSSTTLGHALSYVYSNEGFSHGHALAFTTSIAHKFNNSKFYKRFKELVQLLDFEPICIKQNFNSAAETIMLDRKHLDFNPINVNKNDIIQLLEQINLKQIHEI